MMPPILQNAEQLIAKGVAFPTIVRVLLTLVPSALGITIPMALLLGILIGLGRLSADREFVVLQACGVSLFRLLRPIIVLSVAAWAATTYVMLVALPSANQTFRQITFNIIASKAESDIKPRVFFTQFPNRVLFVRDVESSGGWRDAFLADDTHPGERNVYFARHGTLRVDRVKRIVELARDRDQRRAGAGLRGVDCEHRARHRRPGPAGVARRRDGSADSHLGSGVLARLDGGERHAGGERPDGLAAASRGRRPRAVHRSPQADAARLVCLAPVPADLHGGVRVARRPLLH